MPKNRKFYKLLKSIKNAIFFDKRNGTRKKTIQKRLVKKNWLKTFSAIDFDNKKRHLVQKEQKEKV